MTTRANAWHCVVVYATIACGCATSISPAHAQQPGKPPATAARLIMPAAEAKATRYNGTVAVWFTSHYQIDSRDWNNIEEFKGYYHPLMGYYKSDDPKVLHQQLQWMRRAGIDAIVYDVFSTGKWDLTDLPKDKTLPLLVDELSHQENEPRKLKLIIWLEKYLRTPTADQFRYALKYIRENLSERDFFFRYEGKPLIVFYPNGASPQFDEVAKENNYFYLQRMGAWSYISGFPQPINPDWMPASPGIDPSMETAYIAKYISKQEPPKVKFGPRQDSFFEQQLLRVRQANPNIIFISGWNDWQYGCQIEPAKEYEFKLLDMAATLLGREAETAPYRKPTTP